MEGLGINLSAFIAQIINFVILLLLLYFVAYKPILKMLDQRSTKIKEGMERTEAIRRQAAKAEQEIKAQLDKARKEGGTIIAQAGQIGERSKEEARKEARQEAKSIVAKTKTEIAQERDKVINELRKEFVDIALIAAEKVIKETLDKEKHRRLIEGVIEESTGFKK